MAHVATTEEKEIMRRNKQGSILMLAALHPNIVYRARLSSVPITTDMVAQISFTSGSGTLSDVKPGMSLLVGTSLEDWDLGICRIRKDPISGTFYIGETSSVNWQASCYLTVIQDFDLHPKHLHMDGTTPKIDYDISYSNQHSNFKPIPILGSHPVGFLDLDIGSVDIQFGPEAGTNSYVFGSTITGVLWDIPDAIAIDDNTAVNPIATFNTTGTHVAYCTVTAANGQSKTGVRYCFIWSFEDLLTEIVSLDSYDEHFDAGGIVFSVTCRYNVNLQDIRPGTMCILFAIDYYDGENISIGSIVGQENIKGVGRISNQESIDYNFDTGNVHFTVEGYQELFKIITGFPYGVEMQNTPTAWTDMPGLTVDRALHDLLEWYCTATQIMDVILSGNTLYASELSAPVSTLWQQMEQLAFTTILANIHVDHLGRFFCKLEPLLIPVEDRDYPIVMTIEKGDWKDSVQVEYNTGKNTSQINLSGINVSLGKTALTYFSLAPGHVFERTGSPQIVDRLLLESQVKANQLAGLILSERNNVYSKLSIDLSINNPLITCFPNQAVHFIINPEDTPRGIAVDANFVPRSRSISYDTTKNIIRTHMEFEMETVEGLAVNGDVPGSADSALPPSLPSFPTMPSFPLILPGSSSDGIPANGVTAIIGHDPVIGLVYTSDGKTTYPNWSTLNSGLTTQQYQTIEDIVVCPNGAIYVANVARDGTYTNSFLARAAYAGAPFTVLYTQADMIALPDGGAAFLHSIACNPLMPEDLLLAFQRDGEIFLIYHGANTSFSQTAAFDSIATVGHYGSLSFGLGKWTLTGGGVGFNFAPDGTLLTFSPISLGYYQISSHTRAGTTGKIFLFTNSDFYLATSDNNLATITPTVGNLALNGNLYAQTNPIGSDPTGFLLMAKEDTGTAIKSSDGGATWVNNGVSYLPPTAVIKYEYASGIGVNSCWIAGEYRVWYTNNFGTVWIDKSGNLHELNPFLALDVIKVVKL